MPGSPGSETIRKDFRKLEKDEKLPEVSGHISHKQEAARDLVRRQRAAAEEARKALADAEEEARNLGLDLDGDLDVLAISLRFQDRDLEDFLNDDASMHVYHFRRQGIKDENEIARLLGEKHKERELIGRQARALSKVRSLRNAALSDF